MKSFFKKLALVLSAAMVITMIPAAPAKAADSKSLVIAKQNESKSVSGVELNVGNTVDLKFLGASDWKALGWTWASADKAVAEVNQSGVVTAKAPGFTTVSITIPGYNVATVGVFVNGDNINSLKLGESAAKTATAFSLDVNKTIDLNFYGATGYKASDTVKWTSSNTSVATVNARGLVTAVGAGTTTVRVGVNVAATGKSYIGTAVITVKGQAAFSAKQTGAKTIEVSFASSRDALGNVEIYRGLKQMDGSYFYLDWALESKVRKNNVVTLTSFVELGESVYKIVSGTYETVIETAIGDPATVSVSYNSSYWSEDGTENNNKPDLVVKDKNGIVLDNTKYVFDFELVDTSDEDASVEDDGTLFLYNKQAKAIVKATLSYEVEEEEDYVTKEISSTVTVNAVSRPAYALEAVTGTGVVRGAAKTTKSDADLQVGNDSVVLGNDINANDYGVFGLITDSYGNVKSFGRINCLSYPLLGTAGDDAEDYYVRFSVSDPSKVFVDPVSGQIIGVTETPSGKPGYVFVTLFQNVDGEPVNRGIIAAIPVNVTAPRTFARAELNSSSTTLFTSVSSNTTRSAFGEVFFNYSGDNSGDDFGDNFVRKVIVTSYDTANQRMSSSDFADQCAIESVSAFYKDSKTKVEYEFGDHQTDPSKTFIKCVTINNENNGGADNNPESKRRFYVYGFNINTEPNTEGNKDLNKNEDGNLNDKLPSVNKLDFIVTLKNGTQLKYTVNLKKVNDIRYTKSNTASAGALKVVDTVTDKAKEVQINRVRPSIPNIQVGDYVKEKTTTFSIVQESAPSSYYVTQNINNQKYYTPHPDYSRGVFRIFRDIDGMHYAKFDDWTRNTYVRDNAAQRYVGNYFVSVIDPNGTELWGGQNSYGGGTAVYVPSTARVEIVPSYENRDGHEFKYIPNGTYKIELRRITKVDSQDNTKYDYKVVASCTFDFNNRLLDYKQFRFMSLSDICFDLNNPLYVNLDENNGIFYANERLVTWNNAYTTNINISYPEGSLIFLPGGNRVYVKSAIFKWNTHWDLNKNSYMEKEVEINKVFTLASGKHQLVPGDAEYAGYGVGGTVHTSVDVFNDNGPVSEIYGAGNGDWFAKIMDFGDDEVNVLRITPQIENKTHTGGWKIYVIDPDAIENSEYVPKDPENHAFNGNIKSIIPGTGSYNLSRAKLIGEYHADPIGSKMITSTVDIYLDEPLTGTKCILFVAFAENEDTQAANLHYIAFYKTDKGESVTMSSRAFVDADYMRVVRWLDSQGGDPREGTDEDQSRLEVKRHQYDLSRVGIRFNSTWNRREIAGLDDDKKAEIEEHIKNLESYGLDRATNVAYSNNCVATQYFDTGRAVFVFEDVDFGATATGIDTLVLSDDSNCIMTAYIYIDGEADGDITNATLLGEVVDIRNGQDGNPGYVWYNNTRQVYRGSLPGMYGYDLRLPIHFAPVSGTHRVTIVVDAICYSSILYNFVVY